MVKLEAIRNLVADDLATVDQVIMAQLISPITLIQDLGQHILKSGGKRLRPLLALLSARCFNYQGQQHILLAAIIEFIHTATLLHDDVVDASLLRRGQETANALWGNQASVLVGDFLFSRSFQMMVEIDSLKVMAVLAEASNTMAAGEVLQLMNCHEPDITEEQYMEVITAKTAKLFAAATQLGAHIAEQPPLVETAMMQYGLYLGQAFQLIDDVLDYSSNSDTIGKNIGDDLNEGKPTLPLIYAMKKGSEREKTLLANSIREGNSDNLAIIQEIIASTGAIEYTYQVAQERASLAKNALNILPDSVYKEALIALASFAVQRQF